MWRLILLLIAVLSECRQHEINTAQGKLRGESRDGYVSYYGIPYTKIDSPEGRFKKGGLAPTWFGVRESEQHTCSLFSRVEYCQMLDVHVPSTTKYPWPVLVWVKGGSGEYHPGKLVRTGIIVVIVSHRIGPQGFLSTNEETIPGNAGVKDVILALRWIRDNIVAFKGNPNKVVVAGQSFGAAMVEALMLSPMSHNLYHGIILQSGSILCPWAFNYDIIERATALGKSISSNDNITTTLLNSDMETLVSKCDKLDTPYFPFGITIEKPFPYEERLLGEAPYQLLARRGRAVPMIIGYNSDEAYIFVSMLKQRNLRSKLMGDLSFLIPEELTFVSEREVEHVSKEIQEMYFKNNFSLAATLVYHRDAYFVNHIYRSASFHVSASQSVYFYQFSHNGKVGVKPEPEILKSGAAHSDELAYLFSDGEGLDSEDMDVQNRLVQLWSNFVKYLTPTPLHGNLPQWESLNPSNPRLMDIGAELTMKEFPYKSNTKVWDDIYKKFYYSRNRLIFN